MSTIQQLKPAKELAAANGVRFPNESEEYRRARDALLAEEIELRRHIERVAEQRRGLPAGGAVPKDYRFDGENGPVSLSSLFGDKQTLAIYSYMYGPKRQRPCPMCTSLLSAWDGEWADAEQRIALIVVARSPIERLAAFKTERGWRHLRIYSDPSHPAFLERRDGARHGRPGPGSARRAGSHADLDHFRQHPRRARQRLVSETELLAAGAGRLQFRRASLGILV